ncbi:MAG: MraY family glycosyltransferase [bacterium]|nr:MraY family glycosyltransferase [bacterium]MDD5757337.1 MraY family glycosyltransferase [bacterium]
MPKNLIVFAFALALSLIFTPLVRILAVKFNIMDHPNPIKTHRAPVAYLGGIAIYLAFILGIVIALALGLPFREITVIIIGATLLMILGLVDDLRPLSFKVKLFLEILIATILIIFDIRIKFITPDYIAIILTILWVVGVTNALNIIDIMDGLSSGVAVIAALAFLFINPPSEQTYVNYTAAALAGAVLGFLRYNFPPARIFMGDSGSLVLGFVLAVLSIGTSYTKVNNIALYAPILILGIPIYDTFLVMILRFKQGKNIFHGSLDHFALRLEKLGFSRRKVVLTAYVVSVCLSTAALMISKANFRWAVGIYILVVLFSVSIGIALSKIDMEKPHAHE